MTASEETPVVEVAEDQPIVPTAPETSAEDSEEFDTEALALHIAAVALDTKALDLVIIDVRGRSSYADYIVVCTGRNDRHTVAIAEEVASSLYPLKIRPVSFEGKSQGHWVLLDFGDVVTHIFYAPQRPLYDIEGIWKDAPRLDIEIPEELRASPSIYDGYDLD